MAEPPTLKFVASAVCIRVLLQENWNKENVSNRNTAYMTRLFETECFTAVSLELFTRIVEQYPEQLNNRLLHALLPPHVRDLNLEGCLDVRLMGLVDALKKCHHVHRLNLSRCSQLIHPELFTFVGLVNLPLTSLIVQQNNNITDEVIHAVLKNAPFLTSIDVSLCTNISNNVFLLNEDSQLEREVSPYKSEETYDCSLTSIDISGCRQLDRTAVKHITSLCGPTLKSIDISATNCDCTALLYLAGFSLPAILDILLFNDDLKADKGCQIFLGNYREIQKCYMEQFGPNAVQELKPAEIDGETNSVKIIHGNDTEVKHSYVNEIAAHGSLEHLSDLTDNLRDSEGANNTVSYDCDITGPADIEVQSDLAEKQTVQKQCQHGNIINSCDTFVDVSEESVKTSVKNNIETDSVFLNTEINEPANHSSDGRNCSSTIGIEVGVDESEECGQVQLECSANDNSEETEESSGAKQFQSQCVSDEQRSNRSDTVAEKFENLIISERDTFKTNKKVKADTETTATVVAADESELTSQSDIETINTQHVCKKCFTVHVTNLYTPQIVSLSANWLLQPTYKLGQVCLEKFLEVNPGLQKFSMKWKGLTPEYFTKISRNLQNLREVELEECQQLQHEGVKSLGEICRKCTSVNLRGVVFISDASLIPFYDNNIQHFNLAENSITDKTLIWISERMNETLVSLDISWCEMITEDGINMICSSCPNLKTLVMFKCPVSDLSLELLAETCTKLVELHVQSENPYFDDHLSDDGILALANNFKFLRVVDISWNLNITNVSVCALMKNCCELEEATLKGLKQITEIPFLPIIPGVSEENCEVQELSPLPYRSTVYARNLRVLDLDCSDFVDDRLLQQVVNVCRGTLMVTDYYGRDLCPIMSRYKSCLLFHTDQQCMPEICVFLT